MSIEEAKASHKKRRESLLDLLNSDKDNEEDLENLRGELERMTNVYEKAVDGDGLDVGHTITYTTWSSVLEKKSKPEKLDELKKLLRERLEDRRVSKLVSLKCTEAHLFSLIVKSRRIQTLCHNEQSSAGRF